MKNLRQKTVSGVLWTLLSAGGGQALAIVFMIALARLLTPEEFGLIAMVIVFKGFALVFENMGLGSALIHREDVDERHRSSVFWANIAVGAALTLAFYFAAPLVAAFYDEPLLVPLTRLLALDFILTSFVIVQSTLMRKELDFRTVGLVNLAAIAIPGVIAVGMAAAGFGVWSLAWRGLLYTAVTVVLLWRLSSWTPRFLFDWPALKELLGFGLNRLGTMSLNYWTRRLDNLLIGWKLGPVALGIYSRAYMLLLMPLANVTRPLAQVAFPAFSIIQKEKERVANGYLRVVRLIALVVAPMMLGLLVLAEPFVLAVFGEQWAGMIPVVRVFALIGLVEPFLKTTQTLYLSQGRADLEFRVEMVTRLALIAGIVIGLGWGIVGVAVGYGVASAISFYPSFFFAGRLVGLSVGRVLRQMMPPLACALAAAALAALVEWSLADVWPAWPRLILGGVGGAALYLGAAFVFRLRALEEMRALIGEKLSGRSQKNRARQPGAGGAGRGEGTVRPPAAAEPNPA